MKKNYLPLAINRYIGTILVSTVFYLTWVYVYSEKIISPIYWKGNILFLVLYLAIFFLVNEMYDGYGIGHVRFHEIILSNYLALLITNFLIYIISSLVARMILDIWTYGIMTAGQMVILLIWGFTANKIHFMMEKPKRMLFVSDQKIIKENLKLNFAAIPQKYQIEKQIEAKTITDDFLSQCQGYDGVIIAGLEGKQQRAIIKYCFENKIVLYAYPGISAILEKSSEIIMVKDAPFFYYRNNRNRNYLLKRVADLLFSLIGLILCCPLFLVVALLIYLEDHGPVFYSQKRVTLNGKVFVLHKFRSMIVDAEENGAILSTKEDARITKIGRIIRRYRIDELPQLFNILMGDMSIVGPRPERPELIEELKKTIPEYDFRLRVKAGLTGYAQIVGRYNTNPLDKLKLDLIYINDCSLLMDITIIMKTLKTVFTESSTEGFD